MDRRELITLGLRSAALAAAAPAIGVAEAAPAHERVLEPLGAYVAHYLDDLGAPGLVLTLADAAGAVSTAAYGLSDVAARQPLAPDRLVHIGSISKSFLGLCLMQLQEEGRLDLHRPLRTYLPWLRFDPATRELTAHDLLTHAAALPDGPLFPADPALRHRATAAPGTFFHYCNMGYEALGYLVEALDGRAYEDALRARLLVPLGMTQTAPAIRLDLLDRLAGSYLLPQSDRPAPRHAPLAPALPIESPHASGGIASTARDMGAYLGLLLNGGRSGGRAVVSPAAFERFATAHIAAAEFGPEASYGYGIVVDRIDGHRRLRHTGGMVSFASALEVDLEAGVGVFVSVNAMQGVRPRPVAEYALRLLRAAREGRPLPSAPSIEPATRVANAAEYAGRYVGPDGRTLEVEAGAERLWLRVGTAAVALEPLPDVADAFIAHHPDFAHFPLCFGRAAGPGGRVLDCGIGADWYRGAAYAGEPPAAPPGWAAYAGHYRNEDPWIGSVRVVLRAGRLWLNGVVPLEPAADGRFWLRDDPESPEWVSFHDATARGTMRLTFSGNSLWRV